MVGCDGLNRPKGWFGGAQRRSDERSEGNAIRSGPPRKRVTLCGSFSWCLSGFDYYCLLPWGDIIGQMAAKKTFFHDHVVLLLLSANLFMVGAIAASILLRIDSSHASGYIIQYRANLGVGAYKAGRIIDLLAFIVYSFLVFAISSILAARVYGRYRSYSLVVLSLGTLLLALSIIISNALLLLR